MNSKAYAYIRWSSERQGSGDSEHRQHGPLEEFTASTGIPVVEITFDRGKSAYRGSNAKKGNFRGILERIETGEIGRGDYLLVESIDRLTRERLITSAEMLQGILRKGIRIYTTIDQKCYEVDDPSRDLETLIMVQVIAKRANEESETKSKRIAAAWRSRHEKARQGQTIITHGKSIPFGLRVVDGVFVKVKDECDEVERLFTLMLDTGMNSAIKELNKTSKRKWTTGHIQKMIESRSTIGVLTLHEVQWQPNGSSKKVKIDAIEGYYPNIISPTLFWKVKDRLSERKVKNYSGKISERNFNIFQHSIFCGECGLPMYYDHRGASYEDKIYPHYKCETKQNGAKKCGNDRLRFEYVFKAFIEYLERLRAWSKSRNSQIPGLSHSRQLTTDLTDQLQGIAGINRAADEAKKELETKESISADARTMYENLKRSLGEFLKTNQGNVPTFILERIRDAENALQVASDNVEKARAKIGEGLGLETLTLDHFLEMYKSEDGRRKLNSFLKTNQIKLKVIHRKSDRLAIIRVNQSLGSKTIQVAEIAVHTGKPKLKRIKGQKVPPYNILEKYGIDLQTILNEDKQVSPSHMLDRRVSGKNRSAFKE